MKRIKKINLSNIPSVGELKDITINKHAFAIELIEFKINELVETINVLIEKVNKSK